MWSASVINDLARHAMVIATAEERQPYNPASPEECLGWTHCPAPNLGDYRPAGWCLVEDVMVDSSGFGASWEPALTFPRFKEWCANIVRQDETAGFGIIEQGQFQIVVGYFSQNAQALAECDDDQDEITWAECPHCGEPEETDGDDIFVNEYCHACNERLTPIKADGETCPKCASYAFLFDDVNGKDEYDRWCACGHNWDVLPFHVGDKVQADWDGESFEGVVIGVDRSIEEVIVERPGQFDEYEIPWDECKPVYNPAKDPNQMPLL